MRPHELKPLRKRWTPARFAARMEKRAARKAHGGVNKRAPVHIPRAESIAYDSGADMAGALGILSALSMRRRRR